jgi:hemolysin D
VVEHVSADAITDERRGLVFPARVRITRSRLRALNPRLQAHEAGASFEASGETPMRDPRSPSPTHHANQRALAAILSPGMSAQVEVITGRRSVLSYLLSPIARATSEAGRER